MVREGLQFPLGFTSPDISTDAVQSLLRKMEQEQCGILVQEL